MIGTNARLDEQVTPVVGAIGLLLTSTLGDTDYVSMKGYARCQIIIAIADGTTVTGTAVTLKQATTVAGGGSEKELAFTRMLANTDLSASKNLTETAVTSSTFTTQTTNSKDSLYVIDVAASDLDQANGYDCIRVDCTGHAATNPRGAIVLYSLYGKRYSGATPEQAIAD